MSAWTWPTRKIVKSFFCCCRRCCCCCFRRCSVSAVAVICKIQPNTLSNCNHFIKISVLVNFLTLSINFFGVFEWIFNANKLISNFFEHKNFNLTEIIIILLFCVLGIEFQKQYAVLLEKNLSDRILNSRQSNQKFIIGCINLEYVEPKEKSQTVVAGSS